MRDVGAIRVGAVVLSARAQSSAAFIVVLFEEERVVGKDTEEEEDRLVEEDHATAVFVDLVEILGSHGRARVAEGRGELVINHGQLRSPLGLRDAAVVGGVGDVEQAVNLQRALRRHHQQAELGARDVVLQFPPSSFEGESESESESERERERERARRSPTPPVNERAVLGNLWASRARVLFLWFSFRDTRRRKERHSAPISPARFHLRG